MTTAEPGAGLGERDLQDAVLGALRDPSQRGRLIELLQEGSPVYAQQSRVATARMRGWVLASFERVGLPDDAIPLVIEELESGTEAYLIAAAARAVRGRARPEPAIAPYLVQAILNIQGRDDLVTFSDYGAYALPGQGTTAVGELLATLRWMGSAARAVRPDLEALRDATDDLPRTDRDALDSCLRALDTPEEKNERGDEDCCALPLFTAASRGPAPGDAVRAVGLEDQDGTQARFEDVFLGRPSIVAFFYTRCDNPRKCSLTISKLSRVQRMLAEEGLLDRIGTAAVTYDPTFDLPDRLLQYGRARGWMAHPRHRLLRSTSDHDLVRRHFQAGVSFIASLVNRHRIECFVIDERGSVRRSFTRTQWDEAEVVAAAKGLLPAEQADPPPPAAIRPRGSWGGAALSIMPSVLAAFFPKCALCWAAYMSLFGVAGLGRIPYAPWLLPLFVVMMAVNLGSLWARARGRRSRTAARLGFGLAAAGSASILIGGLWLSLPLASAAGVILTAAGSLLGVRSPLEG